MPINRRFRAHGPTAHALRELIRAEMAHERAASADVDRAAHLESKVREAREHYQRLTAASA